MSRLALKKRRCTLIGKSRDRSHPTVKFTVQTGAFN